MINVEKQLKVTIDGKNVEALLNTCELARLAMLRGIASTHMPHPQIKAFLDEIFEKAT